MMMKIRLSIMKMLMLRRMMWMMMLKCTMMISSDGSDSNFMVDLPIQGFFSAW